jgi:hypothetical protein
MHPLREWKNANMFEGYFGDIRIIDAGISESAKGSVV